MYINYFKTIIQGLFTLFFLLAPLQAAYSFTFTVDIPDDFTDFAPGDGECNINNGAPVQCSLRAAIQEANAWPGTDYIVLPAETYFIMLNGANENAGATGDFDISDDLIIHGAGNTTTIIDGSGLDRVLHILTGVSVTISDITIRNGSSGNFDGGGIMNQGPLTLIDSIVTQNSSFTRGGGIANLSTLNVLRSTISNNTNASSGGGISNGGIGSTTSIAMTITDSTISGNQVSSVGGGIDVFQGSATINSSTISGNIANFQNGGAINNQGVVTVNNSTLFFNSAFQGAGYASFGSRNDVIATFNNSTISSNNATDRGGGLFNRTTLTLNNSTVSNNTGTNQGGGIITNSGGATSVAITNLKQTIVAGNSSFDATSNNCSTATSNVLNSSGYNVIGDASCVLSGTGDIIANPNLGAIGSNGGLTTTHALPAGSPALNIIDNAACPPPASDQRGAARPDGGVGINCDAGSVERISSETTAIDLRVTIDDTLDPFLIGSGNLTYTVKVNNQGPNPATGVTLVNTLPGSVNYVSDSSGCAVAVPTVTCNIGALAVNGSASIDIVVTPTSGGTITNSASASATETDLNTANNTSITEDTLVVATSDLSITKVKTAPLTPEPVLVTENITYQITVTNNPGADSTNGIKVIDTLPAGAALVSTNGTSGTWTCTGTSTVTCNLANTLAASGTAVIEIVVSPPLAGGTITNTARVTFDGLDTDTSNNISSLNTDTLAVAELSVDITESNDPVATGTDYTYQFNISNNGPSPAANTVLTVTLPGTLTLKAIGGASGWNCSGTTTMTCNISSLDASANSVVVFTVNSAVAAPSGTPLVITANVSSDAFDSNAANNDATEQTVVNDSTSPIDNADITLVSLVDSKDPIVEDTNLIYTIAMRNNGPDTAQNVVLTMILPGSVTFVSSNAVCSSTIVGATLQITCTIGSMTVSNTATTIQITVTPTVIGLITAVASITNTAGSDPNLANNDNNKTQTTLVTADTGTTPPDVGTSSGGGCFIATAAYGSYLDPHVMVLRKFRDNYLLTNSIGTQLVEFYYATSPPIADFIRQHEALRTATRWALTPIVFGVEYPLASAMCGLLLIGGISYRRRFTAI